MTMTATTTEKVEEEEEEEEEEKEEGFIAWEEEVISSEKGKRLVHYYFIHTFANSPILAVIGTERSPRHMSYVVADPFVDNYGHLCHVSYGTKWRARRDLLDWLSLLVSPHHSRFGPSLFPFNFQLLFFFNCIFHVMCFHCVCWLISMPVTLHLSIARF